MKPKWYISDRSDFSRPHRAIVDTKTHEVLCVCYGGKCETNVKKILKALEGVKK